MDDAAITHVHDSSRLLIVGGADLLIILELCVAMYQTSMAQPAQVTETFMTWFFSMLIPTLVLTVVAVRWNAKRLERREAGLADATTPSGKDLTACAAAVAAPVLNG